MSYAAWQRARLPQSIESSLSPDRSPYRLGRVDRATLNYQPGFFSGDSASQASQDLMHRRTRDQRRNNPHIKKSVEALQDLIVGTGVQTLADPFEPWLDLRDLSPQELDDRLAYALESDELFEEYAADRNAFSPDGRMDLSTFQRMVVSEVVQVGQCFVIESIGRSDIGPVPQYQIIEGDFLDGAKNRQGGDGVNRIVDGIEIDSLGREVAFWLHVTHPGEVYATVNSSRRVSAERCWHIMLPDRPTQHLGVTWLHASAQPEIDRDQYLTTELAAAKKSAALALVHKKKNPYSAGAMGMLTGDPSTDDNGNQQIRIGTQPYAATIGIDEDVEIVESNRPNSNAAGFLKVIDRYSASGAGLSYYTLTGDYEATNFSSVRAAKLDEDNHIKPLQQWFGNTLALPIRKRFNLMAGLRGAFATVSASEFSAELRRYQRMEAMGPGRDLLDPKNETEAAVGRLRSGLSTLKIECAKRGLHWARVLRQAALENRVAEILGVQLDFSKGQGGQVSGNTRAADQEAQADG